MRSGYLRRSAIGFWLRLENSAVAGFGPEFEGRLFYARHVTTPESDDRDISRQYLVASGRP